MKTSPKSINEKARMEALHSYSILDTSPETEYDELTAYAQEAFGVRTAFISFIDQDRQWFKSSSQTLKRREVPRDHSICSHTILSSEVMVIEDTLKDDRFSDNPLILQSGIRFYAGAPLVTPTGWVLGAFCIVDTNPRTLNSMEKILLKTLSKQVVTIMEFKKNRLLLKSIENDFIFRTPVARNG